MKFAVIGGGMSGLSAAHLLQERGCQVHVYEKASRPGGLVKCDIVHGTLYHMVGGHVFNSRRQDVLDWFWRFFRKDEEFYKATRRAVVSLADGTRVDYPIENHLYQMPQQLQRAVIADLLEIYKAGYGEPSNFDEFLKTRFGKTLYDEYFHPYNDKIWQRPLTDVPLAWLQGKLPMPTIPEILEANIAQVNEMNMVHSTFWYPLHNGTQFVVDTLAKGLDIRLNADVQELEFRDGKWLVAGEQYDRVVYTGSARALPAAVRGVAGLDGMEQAVQKLEYHGTTSVLCEIDKNPYSWIYMPSKAHESHRIICTGNFSPNNDHSERSTATVEFSRKMTMQEIEANLTKIPLHPKYLAHHYEECTYPVQTTATKQVIADLKNALEPHGFFLSGRFAEWEYYNMDAAIGAAMDMCNNRIQF